MQLAAMVAAVSLLAVSQYYKAVKAMKAVLATTLTPQMVSPWVIFTSAVLYYIKI